MLTLWRNKLRASEAPERVFDAIHQVVAETGVLTGKTRRALDSTLLDDAVATQDTATQLMSMIGRVRKRIPAAAAAALESDDYDTAAKPACAWNDPDEVVPGVVEVEGWWSPSGRCCCGIVRRTFETHPEEWDHLMKNVDGPAVRLVDESDEHLAALLPETLTVELGQIAAVCREGLMALSVEAGIAAAQVIMAQEADASCGPWNARDNSRAHRRGGAAASSVVVGGQKLPLRRPRVHAVDAAANAGEVALETHGVSADGDLLNATVMEPMLSGVATRSFERVAGPIGARARREATSTSRSVVSRRFVTGTRKALEKLLARDLSQLDAAVLMIDGVDIGGSTCVVALIVTADGTKVPVGLRLGDNENKTLVKALLADLVDRCLDYSGGLLVVIDGAKAPTPLPIEATARAGQQRTSATICPKPTVR